MSRPSHASRRPPAFAPPARRRNRDRAGGRGTADGQRRLQIAAPPRPAPRPQPPRPPHDASDGNDAPRDLGRACPPTAPLRNAADEQALPR